MVQRSSSPVTRRRVLRVRSVRVASTLAGSAVSAEASTVACSQPALSRRDPVLQQGRACSCETGCTVCVANPDVGSAIPSNDGAALEATKPPVTTGSSRAMRPSSSAAPSDGATTEACLVCQRPEHARGLCSRCYQEARRRLRNGEATEERLIAAGLLKPHTRHTRPESPWRERFLALTAPAADDTPSPTLPENVTDEPRGTIDPMG